MGDTVFYMRSSSLDGINSPYIEQSIDDLREFVKLDESFIGKTLVAMSDAPLFLESDELPRLLEAALPETEARLMARVIRWLHRVHKDGPGFQFISHQLESVERGDESPERAFSQDDLAIFRDRAVRIANCWGSLDRQRKAEELAKSTGQRLQSFQLICDLRPIFDSTRRNIDGVLPVTTMHLVVEGVDGLPNGMDVVLSESDVDRLVEHLAFTKSKLEAIRGLAQRLHAPIPTTTLSLAAKDKQHGS